MTVVWQTSFPRHGRRFEPIHEAELHDAALAACQSLPGASKGLVVIAEATGPMGIPDLTALIGPTQALDERLSLDVPPLLNRVDAGIVAVTHPNLPRSAEAIASALGWPESTIDRRLPGLFRIGALQSTSTGKLIRPAALQPLGRIYAVEAKVRDGRAALRQARGYATWADSYVLVMGKLSSAGRDQLLPEVQSDRGGLVVGGKWLRRPAVQRLSPAARLWAAEFLVAALRGRSTNPQ